MKVFIIISQILLFIQFLQAQSASEQYKNHFSSFSFGNQVESLNYKSLTYGSGLFQTNQKALSYDTYTGYAYHPMIDIFYQWSTTNNDLTVNWINYGTEYRILLTKKQTEISLTPEGDPRTIGLGTDIDQYTFVNVPDSQFLYFHIQAKDKIEGTGLATWSAPVHHKVISKQILVLKSYEEEFITYDVLNKGTWQRQGIWGIRSDSINNLFYLTNSGNGNEKIYIQQNTPLWQKYEYFLRLRKVSGDNNVGLIFKMKDKKHYYIVKILSDKIQVAKDTGEVIKEKSTSLNLTSYTDLKIRIRYDKNSGASYLQVYQDNTKLIDMLYAFYIYGGIGIETSNCKLIVDQIKVKMIN